MRPEDQDFEERLMAYLEGTLDPDALRAFDAFVRDDPAVAEAVENERSLRESLQRQFGGDAPDLGQLTRQLQTSAASRGEGPVASPDEDSKASSRSRRSWLAAGLVLVASLVWALIGWRGWVTPPLKPVFSPEPLVAVYQATVAAGFEPYYECRDAERFATTFAHRLGVPLQLVDVPADSRMLGLSYSGGLSRETTAMLCEVGGSPVIVFVDRADVAAAAPTVAEAPGLRVFRAQREGLVFYEVTPLNEPRMLETLRIDR